MTMKKMRPADVAASDGLQIEVSTTLNLSNTPRASLPQASRDDRGESDLEFFGARPGINSRNRIAFADEPPAALRDESAIAFIRVWLKRDAAGRPATIFREIHYGEWGNA